MAVPKHRSSRSRKGRKASHQALARPAGSYCPHCNAAVPPHRVCPNCGRYGNREIIRARM